MHRRGAVFLETALLLLLCSIAFGRSASLPIRQFPSPYAPKIYRDWTYRIMKEELQIPLLPILQSIPLPEIREVARAEIRRIFSVPKYNGPLVDEEYFLPEDPETGGPTIYISRWRTTPASHLIAHGYAHYIIYWYYPGGPSRCLNEEAIAMAVQKKFVEFERMLARYLAALSPPQRQETKKP